MVALIEDVADHIKTCLYTEYDEAVNKLGWASEMDGYIGTTWDSYELLWDTLELSSCGEQEDRLRQDIADLIPDHLWCETDPYGPNDQQQVHFSWQHFRDVIMHHRRFFFTDYRTNPTDSDIDSPSEVLRQIFDYTQTYELMVQLQEGVHLFRARRQERAGQLRSPEELGPPPRNKATQANRMSPPEIVMLYASEHPQTALRETAVCPGQFVVGRFETTKPITVLDLTRVPTVPSLFRETTDSLEFSPRRVWTFLNHIVEETSKPIARDDRVHINYIPTQIVTEYVRSRLTLRGQHIDGIKYPSAVHRGHGVLRDLRYANAPCHGGRWLRA